MGHVWWIHAELNQLALTLSLVNPSVAATLFPRAWETYRELFVPRKWKQDNSARNHDSSYFHRKNTTLVDVEIAMSTQLNSAILLICVRVAVRFLVPSIRAHAVGKASDTVASVAVNRHERLLRVAAFAAAAALVGSDLATAFGLSDLFRTVLAQPSCASAR